MADLLPTTEVRWFLRTDDAQPAAAWLLRRQLPALRTTWAPPRRDRYLLLPGSAAVGVKLREGRLEIKARRGASEPIHFPGDVAGFRDSWVKWSYGDAPLAPLSAALQNEEPGWLDIEKLRLARRFSLEGNRLQEVSTDDRLAQGCSIEVTRLRVGAATTETWLTIGLEVFGPPERQQTGLARAAALLFDGEPAPWPLGLANSLAYPAWIDGLRR